MCVAMKKAPLDHHMRLRGAFEPALVVPESLSAPIVVRPSGQAEEMVVSRRAVSWSVGPLRTHGGRKSWGEI